jgi:hypothetical protein
MDRLTRNYECAYAFDMSLTPQKLWINRGRKLIGQKPENFGIGNTT